MYKPRGYCNQGAGYNALQVGKPLSLLVLCGYPRMLTKVWNNGHDSLQTRAYIIYYTYNPHVVQLVPSLLSSVWGIDHVAGVKHSILGNSYSWTLGCPRDSITLYLGL